MTKKSTDSEYQVQRNSVKKKWEGHPLNDSDVGYFEDWNDIPKRNQKPFNSNEKVNEDKVKN